MPASLFAPSASFDEPAPAARLTALRGLMPYGLAFIVPLLTLGFLATSPHRGPSALMWLTALPLLVSLDRIGGRARPEAAGSAYPGGFLAVLLGLALLQGINVLLAIGQTFQQGLQLPEAVTSVILLAASSAHTLLVAHELIHKPRRGPRWLGRVLLWSLLYDHFFTEHLRGHHVRAGTEDDPTTAAFDEPFWPYLRRAWPGEWRSAWHLEMRRLATHPGAARWLRSTVLHGAAAQLALLGIVGYLAGGLALAGFIAQAVLAQLVIQVVNYLEHWGSSAPREPASVLPTRGRVIRASRSSRSWGWPGTRTTTSRLPAPTSSSAGTTKARACQRHTSSWWRWCCSRTAAPGSSSRMSFGARGLPVGVLDFSNIQTII